MSLFGLFRVRSAGRDRETDRLRYDRLARLVGELKAEAARESAGLKARHDAAVRDAGFAQHRIEDERAGEKLSSQVEQMTAAIIRYSARMRTLEEQVAFFNSLEGLIENARPDEEGEPEMRRRAG